MVGVATSRCPFYADGMITDSRYFVGRKEEIRFIVQNMTGDQPTSVNIVADRRMGKSSLLYHVYQTYENVVTQFGRQAQEFVVVYVSLRDGNCRSPDEFYRAIATQLLSRQSVQSNPALMQPLQGNLDRGTFFQAMDAWKHSGVLPVVCLDDFEELLDRSSPFDDGFYDNLRSLQNRSELMLVIASRRSLRDYKCQGRNSAFFNISQTWRLKGLEIPEVQDLLRLPDVNQPGLNLERQQVARKWAGEQPYLLQLAGKYLWEAMQANRPDDWARRRFEDDARGVARRFNLARMLFLGIGRTGSWAQGLGNTLDDWGNFVKGMMIWVLLGLMLCGALKWRDGLKYLQSTINDVLKNGETQVEGK
jgi:uncharacterized protein